MILKNNNAQMQAWPVTIAEDSIVHRFVTTNVLKDELFEWARVYGSKLHLMNEQLRKTVRKKNTAQVLVVEHEGVKVEADVPAILQVAFCEVLSDQSVPGKTRFYSQDGNSFVCAVKRATEGAVAVRWVHALISANFRLAEMEAMQSKPGVSASRLALLKREISKTKQEIAGMRAVHPSMAFLIEEVTVFADDCFYIHRPTNALGEFGPVRAAQWSEIPSVVRTSVINAKQRGEDIAFKHPDIAKAIQYGKAQKYLDILGEFGVSHYLSDSVPWTRVGNTAEFEHKLTTDEYKLLRDNSDLFVGFCSVFMRGLFGCYDWDSKHVAVGWSDFCLTLKKIGIDAYAPGIAPEGLLEVLDVAPSWLGGTSAVQRRQMMALWLVLTGKIQVDVSVTGELQSVDRRTLRTLQDELGANPLNWSTTSREVVARAMSQALGGGGYKGELPGGTEVFVSINGTNTFAGEVRQLILGEVPDGLVLTNTNFVRLVDKLFYSLIGVTDVEKLEVGADKLRLKGDYGALNAYLTPSLMAARDLLVL